MKENVQMSQKMKMYRLLENCDEKLMFAKRWCRQLIRQIKM
jgi:hypothetical protein